MAALSAGDAWLVGSRPTRSVPYVTLIEHWDGTSWSIVSGPDTGPGDSELDGMAAVSNGMLWAVGNYSPSGTDQPLIEVNRTG